MTARESNPNNKSNAFPPFVVALGASAGGLQALIDFFEYLGEESIHICYLVIQHIKRDFHSQLASILQQHTDLDVKQAEEGDVITAGRVLVIPPNKEMEVKENAIRLHERPSFTQINSAIDVLFTSIAEDIGPRAIGIIFSGTGTDGLKGVKEIEKNNGIVLVQEPSTAQFDGLPSHIINYDHPDQILAPSEMPQYINTYVATRWEMLNN